MSEIFFTPARKVEVINKVKDSKFYGNITRADNEKQVNEFIETIRNRYHDATHNVTAYKLGYGDQAVKYSNDDGEPAGSSGPPVLQAIEGADLTNTVIVVTRYFGGTKLGIGGLIRAYGGTARMVIEEAESRKIELVYKLAVAGDYDLIGIIMGQIAAAGGKIKDTEYSNSGVKVIFLLKEGNYQQLKDILKEKTGNRVTINKLKELYL